MGGLGPIYARREMQWVRRAGHASWFRQLAIRSRSTANDTRPIGQVVSLVVYDAGYHRTIAAVYSWIDRLIAHDHWARVDRHAFLRVPSHAVIDHVYPCCLE